ncbi:unnamed protein product [Phytomonas sp. EM1]|nr:unnamed protein product [Phytomonas sp. EM1]|eukprot:CCW63197.1 unnamed protein product [Phytomonas sp. isolate EM1]
MHRLLDQCLYHKEHVASSPINANTVSLSNHLNLEALRAYVDRGRARLIETGGLTSVSVKEGSQGDVQGLPCGARTLLIKKDSAEIVARGVNKFFDMEDVGDEWVVDGMLWSECVVWVQRKLAGFVVTLFSLDGVMLICASKHVVEGPHVELSRNFLDNALTSEQQRRLAEKLFQLEASATFECVDTKSDYHHPVLEHTSFNERLILLSVQKRNILAELALCFTQTQQFAREFGVLCVPGAVLSDGDAVRDAVRCVTPWDAVCPALKEFPTLAEGIVLLIEIPLNRLTDRHHRWVVPVRLKVKTTRYIVLRSLRSLLRGDSQPRLGLFHLAIIKWSHLHGIDLKKEEQIGGVCPLSHKFEQNLCSMQKVRHRDSELTVGAAFRQLLLHTEQEVHVRRYFIPLTVVLFCGLPGAGKSSLCQRVIERLKLRSSVFSYGVCLSRDEVAQSVRKQYQIGRDSTRHKQRRLQGLIHRELLLRIEQLKRYCAYSGCDRRGLLLFDACNVTPDARRAWRRCFPCGLHGAFLVFVECKDQDALLMRLSHRMEHATILDAEDAQRALYAVKKKFVPPTPDEGVGVVIRCDTTNTSVDILADSLVDTFSESTRTTSVFVPYQVPCERIQQTEWMNFDELAASVEFDERGLLHGLFGPTEIDSNDFSSLMCASQNQLRKDAFPKRALIVLKLDMSVEDLRNAVASVLMSVLNAHLCTQKAEVIESALLHIPWWRRLLSGIVIKGAEGAHSTKLDATVEAGQIKWIKGWLLQGKMEATVLPATLSYALTERFEKKPAFAHVTLLYSPDGESGIADFWRRSGLRLGQELKVELRELLMDRLAVCFTATLLGGRTCQWPACDRGESEGQALLDYLHVTVCTAAGVNGKYSGEMLHHFKEWQQDDEDLEVCRAAKCAKRSRQKYHNFVKLSLSTPLMCSGNVVVLSPQSLQDFA